MELIYYAQRIEWLLITSCDEHWEMNLHICSNILQEIPRAFQRQFNGMVPPHVILKERSAGRSWHVKLEKLENGLHFTDGWEIFANGLLV